MNVINERSNEYDPEVHGINGSRQMRAGSTGAYPPEGYSKVLFELDQQGGKRVASTVPALASRKEVHIHT